MIFDGLSFVAGIIAGVGGTMAVGITIAWWIDMRDTKLRLEFGQRSDDHL